MQLNLKPYLKCKIRDNIINIPFHKSNFGKKVLKCNFYAQNIVGIFRIHYLQK